MGCAPHRGGAVGARRRRGSVEARADGSGDQYHLGGAGADVGSGAVTNPIITEAVRALIDRRDLTRIEAAAAMEAIMSGAATNAQIAAFLTALRMKGETVEELIGFAQVMRQKAVRVRTRPDDVAGLTGTARDMLIDTCGTGGDAAGTFNVSTAPPFVLAELGTHRAFVVHGAAGLDEISNTGESRISEVREGVVRTFTVRPEDFGVPRASIGDLLGGDREQNAEIIRAILAGEPGPKRDIVLMNASAALVAGGRARDLKEGVELAARSIDSSPARQKLARLVALSQELAREA